MNQEVGKCVPLICQHFQLPENELALETSDFSELEHKLAIIIGRLLNSDMDRLMAAFYKIDLDEGKFKQIISTAPPADISILLAKEVIKRELLKVETREKYKDF
ncbi:hypothetical protein [Reichenbachiella ulvae]|uniref:Uncharacterized protein n=1 Tax=Reichenbachiella ulvae TaxID=2980104 RepID=A0ABT3CVK3_9BACT|nr:hypothetical protein [Reichenbachiella ulvae]MCV9387716.1 hypothetical protein [Reichenbachiella ulvae]